jgi:hypothetical protein
MRNHSQELCRQPPSHVVPTIIHINSKYSNTIHIVSPMAEEKDEMHLESCQRKKDQSINVDYMQTDETRISKKGHLQPTSHSITERLPSVDTRNKAIVDFEDTIME